MGARAFFHGWILLQDNLAQDYIDHYDYVNRYFYIPRRRALPVGCPLILPLAALMGGWSMRQLAERAHVSQAALSDWLRGGEGRLSERRIAQVFNVLELDGEGRLRDGWVYRWRLGEGGADMLDLKAVLDQGAGAPAPWQEFPLLAPGEAAPAYLAFRHPEAGKRALVEVARKPGRPRAAAALPLDYPTPRELGGGVAWGEGMAEGSLGLALTPDQLGGLREPRHHATPAWFDGLLLGERLFADGAALEPYQGLTWQDLLDGLRQRYPRPDVAAFFLKMPSPGAAERRK